MTKTIEREAKRLIYLALVFLLLTGCASMQSRSWIGHNVTELKAKWGEPSSVADDGKGGTILTYGSRNKTTVPPQTRWMSIHGKSVPYQTPATTRTVGTISVFYINKGGIIYDAGSAW